MTATGSRWIVEDHRTGFNPVATPLRRPQSLRRTTSLETEFPEGRGRPARIVGRGRDLWTDASGQALVLAEDRIEAIMDMDRTVLRLDAAPHVPGCEDLVGQSALTGFRKRLRSMLNQPGAADRPAAQLLDDFVGMAIILEWIWTRWDEDIKAIQATIGDQSRLEGACHAYAPGSSAFACDGHLRRIYLVPPLQRANDPLSFHQLQPDREKTQRRVRRIDVWREGSGDVRVDAMFQDSGVIAGNRRTAIHEYGLEARLAGEDLRLEQVEAVGGMLPHAECHSASHGLASLIGLPAASLRQEVLQRLRGTAGCTHLNDAMRALAAVPALARHLP